MTAPMDPASSPLAPLRGLQNEGAVQELLSSLHWPRPLQETLLRSMRQTPIRYVICDDSGSMGSDDGQRIVDTGGKPKLVGCSRWSELGDMIRFQAELAKAALLPTEFRFLNAAPCITVGSDVHEGVGPLQQVLGILSGSPGGGTPLCAQLRAVVASLAQIAPQLRQHGQRAVLVIATDGVPSDGELAPALRPLQALPVQIVLRLCTDDTSVVDYWNAVDADLELRMDVLDDLVSEAREVTKNNAWLTYAEPLHRLREFGVTLPEIDALDERPVPVSQLHAVVQLVVADVKARANEDWDAFLREVDAGNKSLVFDPVSRQMTPWIKKRQLVTHVKPSGGCVVC